MLFVLHLLQIQRVNSFQYFHSCSTTARRLGNYILGEVKRITAARVQNLNFLQHFQQVLAELVQRGVVRVHRAQLPPVQPDHRLSTHLHLRKCQRNISVGCQQQQKAVSWRLSPSIHS